MDERTCSIEGCDKPVKVRGWCGMHYQRWWTHGDPLVAKIFFGSAKDRLLRKMQVGSPDECWPWLGATDNNGYGAIWDGKRRTNAHLVAYRELIGPIPDGMQLDHTCHHPERCQPGIGCPHRLCCNPAHLEPVTPMENTYRSGAVTALNVWKTHCKRGHAFDESNTGWKVNRRPDGTSLPARYCRTCVREYQSSDEQRAKRAAQARKRQARKKAEAARMAA